MKLIKILIVSVFVLFSVNNFALAESALKQILSSGKLKAGTTGDFNPFSVRDTATNKYKGYDIDIMSELAKDMGVEIEFVPTDWKTIVNGVVAGKYHITGSASIKASRMKAAGFSESYLSVNFKPFTTNDKLSKFKGWDSINKKGVKVATTLGTAMEPLVKGWFPNAEIKSVEAPARGYQEVLAGIFKSLGLDVNIDAFWGAVITLAISDSAFTAEIFRAGIQSIHRGQTEAAQTIGLNYSQWSCCW